MLQQHKYKLYNCTLIKFVQLQARLQVSRVKLQVNQKMFSVYYLFSQDPLQTQKGIGNNLPSSSDKIP